MKREWFDDRQRNLPVSFVRPNGDDPLSFRRSFSLPGKRPRQTRKIFVIKKISRMQSKNAADRKVRRILIFDNHPDSLRLVFGRRSNHPYVDPPRPQGTGLRELLIALGLMIAGLVGMFWPLL
jgi:hypothetical protein